MSEQLKPCPFCGGAGREVIRFYEEGAATSIRCQTCKVVTAPFLHIPEAYTAWNTRPGEDKLQERVDALEWFLEVDEFCESLHYDDLSDDGEDELYAIHLAARAAVEGKQP